MVYTPIGSLDEDIFNGSDKHLIWRSIARQVLPGNPEENEQKLARAVEKMFKNFPPENGA